MYLRSRLSAALAAAGAGLIALSLLVFGGRSLIPIICIAAAYAVVTAAIFFSRRGAREIVRETEQDQEARNRQKIAAMRDVRERISVLRLGDERISAAIEYFLQESGQYLETCRRLARYSPVANERIERVMEICQVFLGERDEEATGKRYGVPGSADAPSAETTEGFARDIQDCARVIKERTVEDLMGGSGAEHLEITKELEQGK